MATSTLLSHSQTALPSKDNEGLQELKSGDQPKNHFM